MDKALAGSTVSAGETALVERARQGDHDAFGDIVDGRLGPTFRTALAILGNEADARDATQEIFIRAWRSLPALRDADHFPAWFGRIVVNTCRSAIRGRRRRFVREIAVDALPERDEAHLPWTGPADDRAAARDLVVRALDRLTVADRTLLALHHFDHLSLAEIGERLGIPSTTVKSRLFSARRALERALEVEQR